MRSQASRAARQVNYAVNRIPPRRRPQALLEMIYRIHAAVECIYVLNDRVMALYPDNSILRIENRSCQAISPKQATSMAPGALAGQADQIIVATVTEQEIKLLYETCIRLLLSPQADSQTEQASRAAEVLT